MGKNVNAGQVIGAMVICACGWWYFSSGAASGPTVASDAALSATSIAARIATLSSVLHAEPPSPANGDVFTVSIKQDSIFQGSDTTKEILHTVHNHVGTLAYDGVRVDMIETLVDRYGREAQTPLLRLIYSSADVSKMEFKNITDFDILNLAQPESLDLVAPKIVAQECGPDGDLKSYTDTFCQAAIDAPLVGQTNTAK